MVRRKYYLLEILNVYLINVANLFNLGLYDIDELVSKYKKSAYSNFLNFICHTCRKMVDINDFYLDSELARIIEKYNYV